MCPNPALCTIWVKQLWNVLVPQASFGVRWSMEAWKQFDITKVKKLKQWWKMEFEASGQSQVSGLKQMRPEVHPSNMSQVHNVRSRSWVSTR